MKALNLKISAVRMRTSTTLVTYTIMKVVSFSTSNSLLMNTDEWNKYHLDRISRKKEQIKYLEVENRALFDAIQISDKLPLSKHRLNKEELDFLPIVKDRYIEKYDETRHLSENINKQRLLNVEKIKRIQESIEGDVDKLEFTQHEREMFNRGANEIGLANSSSPWIPQIAGSQTAYSFQHQSAGSSSQQQSVGSSSQQNVSYPSQQDVDYSQHNTNYPPQHSVGSSSQQQNVSYPSQQNISTSQSNHGNRKPSNIDDYADPSSEMPSYMDPED